MRPAASVRGRFLVTLSFAALVSLLLAACVTTPPRISTQTRPSEAAPRADSGAVTTSSPSKPAADSPAIPDSTRIPFGERPLPFGTIPPGMVPDSLQATRINLRASVPPPDSARADSSRLAPADSARGDTLAAVRSNESELDTSIAYSARQILFRVPERVTVLTGDAAVKYKGMTLTANRIEVDWTRELMSATPGYDTLYTDTTNTVIDTIMVVGLPTFNDGGESISGDLLKVNIKTREGYIEQGRTEYGIGFYQGRQIQKVSDEVLYIRDGYFTTSNETPPDYKFTGDEMKMIVGDKVVGKPVVLRFGDVPVFALPFGVFSIQRGRRSGIIIPTYGEDRDQGRYLSDFGYYWAASDYWDLTSRIKFYEKTGVVGRTDVVYEDRYKFRGGVGGSADLRNTGGNGWDLRIRHNQEIDPTTNFNVDASFVSTGDYYQRYSDNANRRLDQRMHSNATLTRRWPGHGSQMSVNLSHDQNLATDENSQTLPNVSYNLGRIYFFPSAKQKKSADKNLIYEPPKPRLAPGESIEQRDRDKEDHWYNTISMSYSDRLQNQRDESLNSDSQLQETWRSGLEHNLSFSAPQKALKYFTVNPGLSYDEDWLLERRRWYLDDQGGTYDVQERGFFQRRTFRASVNTTTKIYGYFPINHWSVETVRHVLTPAVGLSYRPDFSDPEFGYYQRLQRTLLIPKPNGDPFDGPGDPTLASVEYDTIAYSAIKDRFSGSLLGGTPRGRSLSADLSLNNLFQMKRVQLDDQGEEVESKLDLFTYNLSTSYNFAADSLRFGDLSASFRADPISAKNHIGPLERLNIDLSTRHSFYQYDIVNNRRVDKFYWERDNMSGLNFLRLTDFSTSSGFSLSGRSPFTRPVARVSSELDTSTGVLSTEDIRRQIDDRFGDVSERIGGGGTGTPWRINGSIRYSLSMENPVQPRQNLYIDGSLTLQLTQRWQFSYSTRVDLLTREVVTSNLQVTRDLKSWEGSFRWSPQGIGQGFYLRIGLKSPMLHDVQIEQRRGRGTVNPYY